MGAIGVHHTETSDEAWDGPANEARLRLGEDEAYYRKAFAWQDPEGDAGTKAAYKFIHHAVSSAGEIGAANLTACSTGIGVLNGGRGGTTIPSGDRRGVYNHLAAHLRDADREPPELSGQTATGLFPDALRNAPWAMEPEALTRMVQQLAGTATLEGSQRGSGRQTQTGNVAVLPLVGPITQRGGGLMSFLFGGTSAMQYGEMVRAAMADPGVSALVLEVDSPGGSVAGVQELADLIFAARGTKPMVAVSNTLMASAAYWVASQADEVLVSPSSMSGSIGVYALHMDYSRRMESDGMTPTLIAAGKYKVEGNELAPLDESARATIQAQVDHFYDLFVESVARGRGYAAVTVRNGFGEGRMLDAPTAVQERLANRIGTFEDAVARAAQLARQASLRRDRAAEELLRLRMAGL